MVKNTKGGSGHKSLARKTVSSSSSILLPSNPLECLATVTKLFGNGMCLVSLSHNSQLLTLTCHIRGKFRSRNKSSNLITLQSVILVGLRDWETPPKNCDLLFVYDNLDLIPSSILSSLPSSSHSYYDVTFSSIPHSHSSHSSLPHPSELLTFSSPPSSPLDLDIDLFDI